jgi:uncharacterized membrane protein YfhO
MEVVPRIQWKDLTTGIQAYAAAVESVPNADRAHGRWRGSDVLDLSADVNPGEALLVQETYDAGWHAYEGDRAVPIRADAVGHMLIALPPGAHKIRLAFEAPTEVIAGRAAGVIAVLIIALSLWGGLSSRQPALEQAS